MNVQQAQQVFQTALPAPPVPLATGTVPQLVLFEREAPDISDADLNSWIANAARAYGAFEEQLVSRIASLPGKDRAAMTLVRRPSPGLTQYRNAYGERVWRVSGRSGVRG